MCEATIAVGSKNPVKINAVSNGFQQIGRFYWASQNEEFTQPLVEGIDVSSDVSDQPMSDDETKLGSKNRAKNVFKEYENLKGHAPKLAVGLEGGVAVRDSVMECFAWITIYDGIKYSSSRTGSFQLPSIIKDLVCKDGLELGDADDRVFSTVNSKQKGGTVGKLTFGVIDRTKYYADAVTLAMVPFLWPDLYKESDTSMNDNGVKIEDKNIMKGLKCIDGDRDNDDSDDDNLYGLFVSEEYTEQIFIFDTLSQPLLCSTSSTTDHDLTGQIVWPASLLLSWFVYRNTLLFKNREILELGAGAGLAGFVAANCGSKKVIITDGNEIVMRLVEKNQKHLGYSNVSAAQLHWGQKTDLERLLQKETISSHRPLVVMGADVILWPNQLIPLLLTIYWLISEHPDSVCYISYVLRITSASERLFALTNQIGMLIEEIPIDTFISKEEQAQKPLGTAQKHLYKITTNPHADPAGRYQVEQIHASKNENYAEYLPC